MAILDSLPARPLDDSEVAGLNRAESVELAVPLDDDGRTDALLLATESWVKALAFDDDGWTVVETVPLDGVERFDALQTCEDAVEGFRAE